MVVKNTNDNTKVWRSTRRIIFEPTIRQKIANIRPLIIFRGTQTMYTSQIEQRFYGWMQHQSTFMSTMNNYNFLFGD